MSYTVYSVSEYDSKFYVNGVCHCGYGANMPWMIKIYRENIIEPCCNRCKRFSSKPEEYLSITKDMADVFKTQIKGL